MDDQIETVSEAEAPLSRSQNIIAYVGLFIVIGLSATTLLEVVGRYTRLIPTQWLGGELPILFLIWLIAFGIVYATVTNSHLRLDINFGRIRPEHRWIRAVVSELVAIMLLSAFAYYVLQYAIDSLSATTPSLRISYVWMNGALCVAAVVAAVIMIIRTIRMIRTRVDLTSTDYGEEG